MPVPLATDLLQTPPQPIAEQRPRVLLVNRCYWPDAEATGQLLTDLCESLSESFDVSVLCGQPNSNPTGTTFLRQGTEQRGGVTIHRLAHSTFDKRHPAGRMANLVSFTHAARRWLRRAPPYDVLVSETDPFLLPLVVAPHAQRTGAAFIAYLQDIYPDIAVRLGQAKEGWITRQIRRRLRRAYDTAAAIVVLSPAMQQQLAGWGLRNDHFHVIPNWVDCTAVVPEPKNNRFRSEHGLDDALVVMHSGNMGLSQDLETLIDASRQPAFPDNGVVALVGEGARREALIAYADRHCDARCGRVRFFPYQRRERLSECLSAADIQVVSVSPTIGGCLMPSKLYGILASGTPTLAIAAADSDVANLVREYQVGRVVPPGDAAAVAEAIAELARLSCRERSAIASRARHLAETQYDRSVCVERFAQLLSEVLHGKPVAAGR